MCLSPPVDVIFSVSHNGLESVTHVSVGNKLETIMEETIMWIAPDITPFY